VGYSVGVKGARIGTGPRGNYIHLGRGGVYYRQSLTPNTQSVPIRGERLHQEPTLARAGTAITTADASHLADSSSESLLEHIREQDAKTSLTPWGIAISAVLALAMVLSTDLNWMYGFAAIVSLVSALALRKFDSQRKHVILTYKLDDLLQSSYAELRNGTSALASAHRVWRVMTRDVSADTKYTAGAVHILSRKNCGINDGVPGHFQTNIPVSRLAAYDQTFYFFPDQILVYQGGLVGAVSYADISASTMPTRFVESDGVPSDAVVVGRTWQYTNKGGGPDRRFAHNPELPVAQYAAINLVSKSGMILYLHCSSLNGAQIFVSALNRYWGQITRSRDLTSTLTSGEPSAIPTSDSVIGRNGWLALPLSSTCLLLCIAFGPHRESTAASPVSAETKITQPEPAHFKAIRLKGPRIILTVPTASSDVQLQQLLINLREAAKAHTLKETLQLSKLSANYVVYSSGSVLIYRSDGNPIGPKTNWDASMSWTPQTQTAAVRHRDGSVANVYP
jgi:hypothetical protein